MPSIFNGEDSTNVLETLTGCAHFLKLKVKSSTKRPHDGVKKIITESTQ